MITKGMAVIKVERGSIAEQLLQFGDIITNINDKKIESQKEFEELLTEFSKNDYNFKINGIRLTTKLKMEEQRFPKGYEPNTNYKYHIAVIYLIRSCKLALAVKSYNNKVYVTRVVEHTLAGMSLTTGDAILDIDSIPITTVTDTSNLICTTLRKNGYATLLIEQPNNPLATAHVRLALMAEKSIEMDLPLAPDVIDICQQEYKRMKRNPDLKPNQNILKSHSDKPRAINSRIHVSEKTEDVPIACENNPALLMKVPIKCISTKQQYVPLSDTTKQ
uniref:PDZ domain-containing protein n=1 Tax=Loa loa TaxID=7209 RepID=A0A1I7VTI5_LOALO